MSFVSNISLESEGIFVGQPTKEDLIKYFMKQQRLTTIKKLEENDRASSPELSESFEIYLEQKKKKIEIEKEKLICETAKNSKSLTTELLDLTNTSKKPSVNDISCNEESFLELEKLCQHTLILNNVSENLTDLTSMDISSLRPANLDDTKSETRIFEIEPPSSSFFENTFTTDKEDNEIKVFEKYENLLSDSMEDTELSLSYKSAKSYSQSIQTIISTNKSPFNQFDRENLSKSSTCFKENDHIDNLDNVKDSSKNNDLSIFESSIESIKNPINDTLDEIDFLLSQANKISDENVLKSKKEFGSNKKNINTKNSTNFISPYKIAISPKCDAMRKLTTPKHSPLINFSPTSRKNSPATSFKCPTLPTPMNKNLQLSKLNNKKFQHIVSPVSKYIQTSESVLNLNANVQFKGSANKKNFNFRDSKVFDNPLDNSVKVPSLPCRAKANGLEHKINTVNSPKCQTFKKMSIGTESNDFVNNTINDSKFYKSK